MKRAIQLLLALFLLLGLTSCGGNGEESGETKRVVKVYNWGDYIDPGVTKKFEEETGIEVVYTMFDGNEDMYAMIRARGATSFDVVIPSDYMIQKMMDEDMLRKLNLDNIPNLSLIDERFLSNDYDPTGEYSVPYMWGTLGIVYNTTMVDEPVTAWADLWNTKYERRLFMMDSVRDSMGLTLKMLGHSMNTREQSDIDEAYDLLKRQKPLVLDYTGDEVKDRMIAGEAALAVVYSGDAITIMNGNKDIEYVIPSEGSNVWFDAMCILKSSVNVTEAEEFINFMCRTDIARLNYEYINFASPQKEVIAGYLAETVASAASNPTDEELARCEIFADLGDFTAEYENAWSRVLAQ